jgi:biotin carboxyl carrier protein
MKKEEPFKVLVNSQHEFDLQVEDLEMLDLIPDGAGRYHVLLQGKSYHAELLGADYATRQFHFNINGTRFSTKISDHYDRLIQQLGLTVGGAQKINAVKAPMPGLVLNILVAPGQSVAKGEPLLILEAMKMENVLKAASDGTVKSILVGQGAAVEKGQLLVEME